MSLAKIKKQSSELHNVLQLLMHAIYATVFIHATFDSVLR